MEEVEWYGLTMKEAMIKNHLSKQVESKPLKHLYRQELLQYLRESKDTEIEDRFVLFDDFVELKC